MKKGLFLFLGLVGAITAVGNWSCSQNAMIILSISGSGCNVTITMDGGNPVTEAANNSSVNVYSNVAKGHHTFVITSTNNASTSATCNYDIDGGSHTISVLDACSTTALDVNCN